MHASALYRAAARGDSLDQLLDIGVQTLLATAGGDRAGLWLAGEGRDCSSRGRVVEAVPGHIPEQWKYLDISAPFLRAALESADPLLVELGPAESISHPGLMIGMSSAIWIPLRLGNRPLGLGMVAHAHPKANTNLEAVRGHGDEIAFAVKHHQDARRREMAAEELHAQLRLSRAILCGVSVESILPQIARAARHYIQAEFIALGGVGGLPASAEGWDGPDEWRRWLHQEPLLQLWRKTAEQGEESDLTGEAIPVPMGSSSRPVLDRLIAIPLPVRNCAGVLMAGLLGSEDGNEDFARLESYALMATSVLDRDRAREQRAVVKRSLRQVVEGSHECLVLIDEKGIVREASLGAASHLFPARRRLETILLDDFFSPAAREKVAQWRNQFSSADSAPSFTGDRPLVQLEAALHRGAVVRLRLRSAVKGLYDEGFGDQGFGDGRAMWLVEFEDLEKQKATREAEGRLEAEMAGLLDSIDSGVLVLDPAGRIRIVSDRLGAIMGIEAGRLLELGTVEALMDALAPKFSRPAEAVTRWRQHMDRGDEASWDEFELIHPTRRIIERFARPLFKPDGTRLGWLEVYRDITGQRLIQSKLLQSEKMAALGQLVSGIAHELNNPLTSIQGYAQLLLGRRSDLDRSEDVRRISQEAERAGRIVKNLLLFSRETKPERRAVNLNELIERTLALRAYELKLENIAMELMLDPSLPNTMGDAAQLQQVILNLIVNSEQAILQGGGEEDRHGRIQIRTRRLAGDRIGIEVSDDGPGISPEVVARIFDPFFTTKPAGIGTGLGLSIVYGIVQAHGGEVSVESQPGHGATLTVELRALSVAAYDFTGDDPATPSSATAVATLSPSYRATTRSERILVVEDEPTVAQLIADVMAEEGHRVDTLLDSREALGRLEKRRYGLLICDLKMPHFDGPGLYRALVGSGNPLQQKILFVTGDTMSPRTIEFLRSSGLPYLAKPFLVEELKESVRQAFAAMPDGETVAASKERLRATAREK